MVDGSIRSKPSNRIYHEREKTSTQNDLISPAVPGVVYFRWYPTMAGIAIPIAIGAVLSTFAREREQYRTDRRIIPGYNGSASSSRGSGGRRTTRGSSALPHIKVFER